MAECCASGMTIPDFWIATQRETFNFLTGAAIARRRDRQLAIFHSWHTEAFARKKTLPPLAPLLAQLEPKKVMSPTSLRAAIIEAAKKSGANVVYIKKGER